uniref:Putative secreted protein n=1 Tax=Amblyomma americanum TaxID=6943 RepID=A0A0C9S3L4_AMBAM
MGSPSLTAVLFTIPPTITCANKCLVRACSAVSWKQFLSHNRARSPKKHFPMSSYTRSIPFVFSCCWLTIQHVKHLSSLWPAISSADFILISVNWLHIGKVNLMILM